MTQRVSDEHVQKVLLDARAEIATLRAKLDKVCEAAQLILDASVPYCVQDIAADLLDARAEIERLRAALNRCHSLIEAAINLVPVDEYPKWHADVEAELLPCDVAGSCPPAAKPDEVCGICGHPGGNLTVSPHSCYSPLPPADAGEVVVAEGEMNNFYTSAITNHEPSAIVQFFLCKLGTVIAPKLDGQRVQVVVRAARAARGKGEK